MAEKRNLVILFNYGGRSYRMRVARSHEHPGEVDRVEVAGVDMFGGASWSECRTALVHGSGPSAEWLVRRALWAVCEDRDAVHGGGSLTTVDLGVVA